MNILISVDKNYLDKALTMLFSLRRYVEDDIVVYLLNHRLCDEEVEKSKEYLMKTCSIRLECIDLKESEFDNMPTWAHFSIEMYYRILAQFLLPESIERVLWLDADIIVLKDITAFYKQSFEGKKYIVASDYGVNTHEYWKPHRKNLGFPDEYVYFNSGVMLMDLVRLRKETSKEKIIRTAHEIQDHMIFPDQDILNYLYQEDVKYVDWKIYNYQHMSRSRIDSKDLREIAILHYVGGRKPWQYWSLTVDSCHYWKTRVQQGYWKEAVATYWKQYKELMYVFFKDVWKLFSSVFSRIKK